MRRIEIAFALALRLFLSAGCYGTIGAVFGPVGFGHERGTANDTGFHLVAVKQSGAQTVVLRQNGGAEPAAQERVGNTLNTDAL